MDKIRKFEIKYDYSIIMLFSERSETLIGGTEKALKRAVRNRENPNLDIKDLDVYYREVPLGTFAAEIYKSASEIEVIQKLVDKLYANLIDKNSTRTKVADTKLSLNSLFGNTKNNAVIRVLARTISVWYAAVTDYYMNGKFGIPISQKERAKLGEQFREDANALIETIYTVLKKKISPQSSTEIRKVIQFNCTEIGTFLVEYSHYLTRNKVFCIRCNLCDNYFLANSWNARYCTDCRLLRKKNSKKNYTEKCSEGVHNERQRIKFRFENFIHKSKVWCSLSDDDRAEYQALREAFISQTADMLREYERNGGVDLERDIWQFLRDMDSARSALENKLLHIRQKRCYIALP